MKTYTVKKGETLSGIGKKMGVDWKKITGYKSGDPNLIYPGEKLNIPGEEPVTPTATPGSLLGLGDEVKNRALGAGTPGEETETPQDKLISDLTSRLTAYTSAPSLMEEKGRLEEEKGVLGMRERVGSFEEEMATTQTLLDQLEGDITKRTREFLVSEPQRRRVLATEREPLMEQLGIATRGLEATTGRLERTEQDILTELGLLEKERTMPMDLFERELSIRSQIKDLTTKDIPNVTTSQFNDEGDLTIVTQDPTTGAFNTQTIKGIGKKASEYEQFSTITNDAGDVTIIGIKRDGTTQQIGSFKGIGKAAGGGTVDTTQKQIRSYINSIKDSYMATKGKTPGYREDLIDSLITDAGEEYRDFITNEVYTQLVDIGEGTGEQFLTRDWFINTYGENALTKQARSAGHWLHLTNKGQMDAYIEEIMKAIEVQRQAGKSDQDILAEMMKE